MGKRPGKTNKARQELIPAKPGDHCEIEQSDGQVKLFTLSPRISTLEEALEKAKVNREEWEVKKFNIKSWEVGAKIEASGVGGTKITRGVAVCPMFAVSVELAPKTGWSPKELRAKLIADMKKSAPKVTRPKAKKPSGEELMLEVAIFDHHMGKLAWKPETGEDYDIKIASARYRNAVEDLLGRVSAFQFGQIIYPIGNDFLHVDRGTNTTTKGTRVDTDGRWQKAYLYSRQLITDTVNRLSEVAPVHVIVVPGNHDEERMFLLGDAIGCQFDGDSRVSVDNSPMKKKAYQWGCCLIGFEHGDRTNETRRKQLPMNLAVDFPDLWAQTTWREIHLGHFHTEREDIHKRSDTVGATIVRTIPSLCGTDQWHFDEGYRGLKACEAHLWSKSSGRVGYFTASPRD